MILTIQALPKLLLHTC